MNGQINGNIKKDRAKRLLALSDELSLKYNQLHVDEVVEVLIEEKVDDHYVGHTSNFIKVKVVTSKDYERNSIIKVKISKAFATHVLAMEE